MLKPYFTTLLIFLFLVHFAQANEQVVYQFPARPEDAPKLVEVANLMGFLQNTYGSQVSQKGVSFRWNFDWNQEYIGAGSSLYHGEFSIMYFGGFSRMPESHFGVVALTLCHEFGHLLGGEPKQRLEDKVNGDWSSAEGQSDWFAATDCLPKVYQFFKNKNMIPEVVDKNTKKFCLNKTDSSQCEFVVNAGLRFSEISFKYFNTDSLAIVTEKPSVDLIALEKPEVTLHSRYPSMQCRLDIYKQGALCSEDNKSCLRPRCWYNPERLF